MIDLGKWLRRRRRSVDARHAERGRSQGYRTSGMRRRPRLELLESRVLLSAGAGADVLGPFSASTGASEAYLAAIAAGGDGPVGADGGGITAAGANSPPVLTTPLADLTVQEDAVDTVLDATSVFSDPDLPSGDWLSYSASIALPIPDVVSQVSQASYTHFHQDLLYTHLGDNRGVYGPQHDLARDNIASHFTNLGLQTSLQPFTYAGGTYYNVIGVKPGATRPGEMYLVGAHYDSVNNPGADDNASGTAAVMELARVLAPYQFDTTLVFLAFDREEQGLYGSYAYASAHRNDHILGMVSLDMIAYNPAGNDHDTVHLFDWNGAGRIKSDLAAALAQYSGGLTAVDAGAEWGSDHYFFEWLGFDAALAIEAAGRANPYYHQAADAVETPGYLDYTYATGVTRAMAGYLAQAAGVRTTSPLLTVTVQGGQVVLDYAANASGAADIRVRAADSHGLWAEDTFHVTVLPVAHLTGRYVFYNHSAFDGDNPAATDADYDAIAPAPALAGHGHTDGQDEPDKPLGKQALLPGQTATFANYTSYARGINGILVAFDDLGDAASLTAADFVFRVASGGGPASWPAAPAPASFRVDEDVVHANFPGRPDVVTMTWADDDPYTAPREAGAISNQWLQVTVLASPRTGLAVDEVFYWGNQIGESGNSAAETNVDQNDEIGARNHPHTAFSLAAIGDPYDFNRDRKVDQNDEILARNTPASAFTRIALIATPSSPATSSASLRLAAAAALADASVESTRRKRALSS